jgi:FPC/CPF motif-containing protein YcgG
MMIDFEFPVRPDARNSFRSERAIANSNYLGIINGDLVHPLNESPSSSNDRRIHTALKSFIVDDNHPCIGARAAFKANTYRFGIYAEMASDDATAGLARDLWSFVVEFPGIVSPFSTFIAIFNHFDKGGEFEFEARLWDQLQALHEVDGVWNDVNASRDPENTKFAFSFAEAAFFVVGVHPDSSRLARRFERPALIFNPRSQFDRLRSNNQYDRFAGIIRARDIALQGSLNPNLDTGNERSEARQYSGRAVEDDWRCPFRFRP